MGSAERRAREREATRRLIVDTAREMFAQAGYDAVTMRAIADRIEYTPTTIYHHFRDKHDLITEICRQDFLALGREAAKLGRVKDPVARLRALGQAYVDFALAHPNHYRIMFMAPLPPHDHARMGIEKRNPDQDAYGFLLDTVRAALAAGRFRPAFRDPEALAQLVWAGVHGVVSLYIVGHADDWIDWRDPREAGRLMVDTLLRGLLRPRAAAR
jgi:AcrR family transcriptional regulator